MSDYIIFGLCLEANRDLLNDAVDAAWGIGRPFSTTYSNDGGTTLTHLAFNDSVDQEDAIAWQALNTGTVPPPISGAWGENGLPSEAAIIAAAAADSMWIVSITGDMDADAVRNAALNDLNLVVYDPLAGT